MSQGVYPSTPPAQTFTMEARDMQKLITSVSAALLAALLLAGCSLKPIKQDQRVVLGKNQGLAAIAFDLPDSIRQVYIQPTDGHCKTIEISSIAKGKSIYLFVVPAGKYCLEQFHTLFFIYNNHGDYQACFKIPAGKLGYSVEMSPAAMYSGMMMNQNFDVAEFHTLLRSKYPKIAAQFLPAK